MRDEAEQARNEAAYRGMKGEIGRTYPARQFVAFGHGRVIADSADFDLLLESVRRAGRDPREVLVVRVGDEDLGGAAIFCPIRSRAT